MVSTTRLLAAHGGHAVWLGAKPRNFVGRAQVAATSRGTPNVRTTTSNLADLVAFTRALQWATTHWAAGKPVCIRYSSEYAARIASGAWRAKKHKPMAAEARRAWHALRKLKGGDNVWMQHAPVALAWSGQALQIAKAGQSGTETYAADVD